MARKSFVKSLGFWGGITSITALLSMFNELVALYESIPPELIEDTRLLVQAGVALAGSAVALFGRWRAKLPLSIFNRKEK